MAGSKYQTIFVDSMETGSIVFQIIRVLKENSPKESMHGLVAQMNLVSMIVV